MDHAARRRMNHYQSGKHRQLLAELRTAESALLDVSARAATADSAEGAHAVAGVLVNLATTLAMAQRFAGELAGVLYSREIVEPEERS